MAKAPKKTQYITPVIPWKYVHLNKPDFGTDQYPKKDGEFSVTAVFDKDDPEVQAFLKQMEGLLSKVEAVAQEAFDAVSNPKVKAAWKKKGIDAPVVMPFYTEDFDEEGNPTGLVTIKFKTKAQFTKADGTVIKKTVPFIDAYGEIIPGKKRPLVYAGTTGRIAFTTGEAFIQTNAEAFLSFYLNQVQLVDLVSSGGGKSAFGAVEGGGVSADELDEYEPDEEKPKGNAPADDDEEEIDDEIPF